MCLWVPWRLRASQPHRRLHAAVGDAAAPAMLRSNGIEPHWPNSQAGHSQRRTACAQSGGRRWAGGGPVRRWQMGFEYRSCRHFRVPARSGAIPETIGPREVARECNTQFPYPRYFAGTPSLPKPWRACEAMGLMKLFRLLVAAQHVGAGPATAMIEMSSPG